MRELRESPVGSDRTASLTRTQSPPKSVSEEVGQLGSNAPFTSPREGSNAAAAGIRVQRGVVSSWHFALRFTLGSFSYYRLQSRAGKRADRTTPVVLQPAPSIPAQPPVADQFSADEIVDAGQHFFSTIARGLASVVEKAVSRWGLPNGYILGEEAETRYAKSGDVHIAHQVFGEE